MEIPAFSLSCIISVGSFCLAMVKETRCTHIRRRTEAKHCSSLCSQSEGDEYWGGQAWAENPTRSWSGALAMFATCSWPSLCEQSELQCWRRNRRPCWPAQISTTRAYHQPNISPLPYPYKKSQPRRLLTGIMGIYDCGSVPPFMLFLCLKLCQRLHLDFNFNTASQFQLHQSVNCL